MKLKDSFVVKRVQDKLILVSTETETFNGILDANNSAGFIIECMKEDVTREEIISKMLEIYNASVDVIIEDVDKVIESLKGINAIDE